MKKTTLWVLGLCLFFCSGRAQKNKFIRVYFPDGFSITAELAVTEEERAQGLMFRERIEEDQGMLFVFEQAAPHAFWMKNMRFAIDILWLDAQRKIIHLEPAVPPCLSDPCPSYGPTAPAAFVLEVESGFAEKHKLRLYDRLEFILPKDLSALRDGRL